MAPINKTTVATFLSKMITELRFISGQTPDDDGNYAFQFATDDGQYRQETGRQVATADGDATEITGSNPPRSHFFETVIVGKGRE